MLTSALSCLKSSQSNQIVVMDNNDINIMLSKYQLLNHIVIINYVDVSADVSIILSKSQSSNQIVITIYVDVSADVSVVFYKTQSFNQIAITDYPDIQN
jgi:hypothetical protein